MATGLEMYDALRRATGLLPAGSVFRVNAVEAHDLRKLTVRDLVSRDVDEKIAEGVSSALLDGNYELLARSMGLRLHVVRNAPRLLP